MKSRRTTSYFFGAVLLGLAFLLLPDFAHASVGTTVAQLLGSLISAVIWLLGKLLVLIVYLVVWVAQYNEFVTSPAVTVGWGIVRDICNMFFIVILLVIAFCTILNIKEYSLKHLLPKLLLMAVLINFSKIICGVIIDVAQVFMLTFVNGFKDVAGGNFGAAFGISGLLNVNAGNPEVTALGIAGTYILALIYVVVALVIITIILAILIVRMIMIWIYVVLSPFAYLLNTTPTTKKYAAMWWQDFTGHVVAGPVLAFFIWLSFATISASTSTGQGPLGATRAPSQGNDADYLQSITGQAALSTSGVTAGMSDAGTPEGMIKFVVAIGMLMGGLMITKKISGTAASVAGKVMNKADKVGGMVKKFGANRAKGVAQKGMRLSGWGAEKLGNYVSKKSGGKYGESLQKSGKFVNQWGNDIKDTRKKERDEARKKTLEKLGMKEGSMNDLKAAADTTLGRAVKGGLAIAGGIGMMATLDPTAIASVLGPVLGKGLGAAVATVMGGAPIMGGGLAHMVGATNSKWVGKFAQDKAKETQQNKDLKSTQDLRTAEFEKLEKKGIVIPVGVTVAEHVEDLKRQDPTLSQRTAMRDAELDQHTSDERRDEADIVNNFMTQTNGMATNSQAYKDFEKDKDDAVKANKAVYDERRKDVTDRYNPQINDRIQRIEAPFADAMVAERAHIGVRDRDARDSALLNNTKTRDDSLKQTEVLRSAELKDAEKKFKSSPVALADAQKNINQKHDATTAQINDTHSNEEKRIKEQYKEAPELNLDGIASLVNKTGSAVETKYQPNRQTIDGAALGAKEFQAARDTRANLEGTHMETFEGKTFSTGNGISAGQEKLFALLADSSVESKKALLNMTKTLRDIKTQGRSEKNKGLIEGIMKGIAHFIDKKPEGKAGLSDLISTLEAVHHDGKKVDDFKPKKAK